MNNTTEQENLLTSWLAVIGAITLFWSPIERQIDQIVHALYKSHKKKKPHTLRHKLDYIKSLTPIDVIRENDLENLIDLTKRTVQIRDVCVHGMLQKFDENSMTIGKVQGKSEEHLIEVFTIDRNRLDKSAENMLLLNQRWSELATSVVVGRDNG